ncbi:MAG: 23S rRNA (guanosine(2251)-2'-O)-methyltransferase RlmB [Hyphomonadaceae bacterium]|jgi:23S rRNA (guanosine2251-2'-O)-methyltransferase|nr:23S rRNA (guanosine(2251)-2'-O)-methyltransferase RlmB [Hyphomonadaceae bacterium]
MRDRRRGGSSPRGAPERAGRGSDRGRRSDETPLIFGIHAVEAALANPQRIIRKLFLTDNAERRLHDALAARQLAHERVLPRDLDRRLGADTVHQGALIEAAPLSEPTLADLAEGAQGRPLIVLDQVTDPHNVGAILRSAAVFGAAGLIMTRRHSPPLDGALAKSASGALEHVPVSLVQNLARGIADLKALHFTVLGLDGSATEHLEESTWPERAALVLGAEGKGLRQLTHESCDRVVRIATDGAFASLNVSNAAAVALHWAAVGRLGLRRSPR